MMIGVKMMKDDMTWLMIPVRKTWSQWNVAGEVSEEVDSRSGEMSSEKNGL